MRYADNGMDKCPNLGCLQADLINGSDFIPESTKIPGRHPLRGVQRDAGNQIFNGSLQGKGAAITRQQHSQQTRANDRNTHHTTVHPSYFRILPDTPTSLLSCSFSHSNSGLSNQLNPHGITTGQSPFMKEILQDHDDLLLTSHHHSP